MPAKDRFHNAVSKGLAKQGWQVTHDPFSVKYGDSNRVEIDLAAEEILAAERAGRKIAVEVKSFLGNSSLFDFHVALGQFLNYRLVLNAVEPERTLYLAVPLFAFQSFFNQALPQASVKEYEVKLLVYDPKTEVIVQWIE